MTLPPLRMALPIFGAIAAGAVALGFGIQMLRHEPPVATSAATVPPVGAKAASEARRQAPGASAPAKAEAAGPAASGQRKAESGTDRPTFDIASVDPAGEAVIAGRAVPGAAVELLADGKVFGQATADQSGEFVIVPKRLPPGNYDLTLRARRLGGEQVLSQQKVSVSLQPRQQEQAKAAVLTAETPARAQPQPAALQTKGDTIAVDTVEMQPGGRFHVSGRARPGAAVKLYLNESFVASATAGADQRFAFTINEGVRPGDYRVRLDEVEPKSGAVRAHSEVAFKVPAAAVASVSPAATPAQADTAREASTTPDDASKQEVSVTAAVPAAAESSSSVIVPKIATTTVARGDNLWNISRDTYGDGTRYPDIVGANRAQIRDPNLIYPGQIFVLPNK